MGEDDRLGAMLVGRARYTDDLARADALHMAVVRSDVPHAVIRSIESEECEGLPGVHSVLTARDLTTVPTIPIRVGPTDRLNSCLQPVLASDRVRYVGEPIAVVLAETAQGAVDGAGCVYVDLMTLDAVGSPAEVTDTKVHAGLDSNVLVDIRAVIGQQSRSVGEGDQVLEMEFRTARRTGLPIEPRRLVAEWVDDELHIWGATKFIHFTRRTVASFFGIDPERVRCHRVDVGGMFGVRGEVYPEDFLVPWAASVSGRMVRWEERRREHFLSINHAAEQHHRLRVHVGADGRVDALDGRATLDLGAYPRPIGTRIPHIVVESLPGPYTWSALDLRCIGALTNKTPTGTMRGPAAFETAFVRERAMDEVARRLGVDPLAFRRRSLIPPDAMPYTVAFNSGEDSVVYESGDFPALLDDFELWTGYREQRTELERRRRSGEVAGLGMAATLIHSGLGTEESVQLGLTRDGTFELRTSAVDVGQGFTQAMSALIEREFGVGPDQISIWSGDSDAHDEGNGTFSSRSSIFVGNALADAAGHLRRKLADRASEALDCDSSSVTFSSDGPRSLREQLYWKDLAPLDARGHFSMGHPAHGLALHLSRVTIDPETGDVHPEVVWVAYDSGTLIDRQLVVNQMVGAACAGVSGALYERIAFDGAVPVSASLDQYILGRAPDMPEVRVMLFEGNPSPTNPLGFRGVGEAGGIGVGAAIGNAVADALGDAGAHITGMPIRSEEVVRAMRSMDKSGGSR